MFVAIECSIALFIISVCIDTMRKSGFKVRKVYFDENGIVFSKKISIDENGNAKVGRKMVENK